MPTQTPSFPAIPRGEDLYSAIMAMIEPDLLTVNLPNLDAKYHDETPEQAAARSARYDSAFAEYEKQLNAYLASLETQVQQYRHGALASAEHKNREAEKQKLSTLEQEISNI